MNISDIAALAGVSKAAVSRYFNDGYLSEEKRAAIERAVAETGYTPNIQAQTLRTRRSGQIGVVIPRLSSESVARVTDGISQVLSEQGYQLILTTTANDPRKEVEYLELLRHHHVEGVIFLASIFTPDHERILQNMHVPVVIVGQQYGGCSCVYHDDRGAAKALTALMIARGSRRPACIGVTKCDRAAGAERCTGFLDALHEAGLEPRESDLVSADFSIDSGYEKAGELLARPDRPDALFCATDNIAAGAMLWCCEHGLRVPDDVLLCGVGDSKMGRVTAVALTSAHLFYHTAGEEAARLLLAQLRRRTPGGNRSLRLGYEIVERASTRGPGAGT